MEAMIDTGRHRLTRRPGSGRVGRSVGKLAVKLADARHASMLRLSDLLRGADTKSALFSACALMGSYFNVTRVGYGQLDAAEDIFDYAVCWTGGDVPTAIRHLP